MTTRFLDAATTRENHERFVRRTVEHERVWTLEGDSGVLIAESTQSENDDATDGTEPRSVFLFFSDEPYAKRALRESWSDRPDGKTMAISLFYLLYRWLPGMHRDGHLAGTNWTGDLIGVEIEPADLQSELRALLSEETRARHLALLDAPE